MSMRYPGGLIATSPVNARYPSGVWTQAQAAPYQAQNVWTRDQFWPYTTLLLQGDGATNGAQNNTFLDSSSNNFTITRNGNTTQGAFTPYEQDGYWSNYFSGSGDVNAPSNAAFTYGTSDFTIEGWFFITGRSGPNSYEYLFAQGSSTGTSSLGLYREGGVLKVWNGSAVIIGTTTLALNTWNHIALSRSGTTMRLFLNGVQEGSATNSNSISTGSTYGISVGRWTEIDTNYIVGYVSNFRVVKGTAVYTSAFTPSAAPLTAITNTSLLTCQSNRFKDNSTNNFTLTVNSTPSVQAFQPFPGATTWSASVLGGSGYFDGSGDFLNTPSTGQFAPAGDFTISCWYYPTSTRAYQQIIGNYNGSASTVWIFEITSGTGINFYTNGTTPRISGSGLVVNAWNYLVLARSGSTITGYVNGVSVGTYSQSGTFGSATQAISIGRGGSTTGSGDFGLGYIADVKLIDGSAITTVPTAPQTATSGTSLLLNMTNAGIYDNSMMNNLETVGNAQVSTSVVKYGTGSMAFDGNGDYLTIPPTQQLNFGSGNFTFEFWAYLNTTSGSQAVWHTSNFAGDTPGGVYIRVVSGAIEFAASTDDTFGTRVMVTSSTSLPATTWTHVACVRNGNTLTIYINGTSSGSATFSGSAFWSSTYYTRIGYWRDGDIQYLNAYLDDFRITKGAARYITNFTPPPARMPGQ